MLIHQCSTSGVKKKVKKPTVAIGTLDVNAISVQFLGCTHSSVSTLHHNKLDIRQFPLILYHQNEGVVHTASADFRIFSTGFLSMKIKPKLYEK